MALPSSLPRAGPRTIVLVIDGDSVQRAMYAYALSACGFDVIGAADADEAHWAERRPDIILANVSVNGGYDWALLRTLRADPETHDIPVVAVTDNVAPPVCARAEREGCAALCLKSCPPAELALGLRAVLDRNPLTKGRERRARWDAV